ncbi:alpha/beta fold hydrolase [Ramlibacter henchirensis]|uniref:Alpha/beta fold hydrolase n=1 Tax=Ramlibacter henchirensis TaxID=204072 RepID=A0A4Z0BXE8_9BURK|nr:alpha/beta fold hydrolase [Ramlibacter henchirensis]TFZ02948.1 alpha/beta fold hydrolase [Ramlibacter henchirensis]
MTTRFKQGHISLDSFELFTGEVLDDVRLAYRTLGEPRLGDDGSMANAVLLFHGTGSSSALYERETLSSELFSPGGVLDPARYFIVLPDALGHGGSTKPSDGLRGRFPMYGYRDMVKAQYLLARRLGIQRAELVGGISMGAMHTWLWGTTYPDFAKRLFPISSFPVAIAGRNLLWRQIIIEAILNDPGWQDGNYTERPTHWANVMPIMKVLLEGPAVLLRDIPDRNAAKSVFDAVVRENLAKDPADMLRAYQSSHDYDPLADLGKIRARLVAVNFEDDVVLPAELNVLQGSIQKVAHGMAVLVPAGPDTNAHYSQIEARFWAPYLRRLMAE